MKIAYLTSMYPDVSHTFILREIQALRALGVDITTFSIRRSSAEHILGTLAEQEATRTRWLVPPDIGKLASALLWALATRPVRSGRTLLRAVLRRGTAVGQRFKWLCYFVEAILLAHWLERNSLDHLHCHFGNSGSSTGMLAAQLARVPFSMTCHGSELLEIDKHRLTEKVAGAEFVACVSKHGRAQLMLACHPQYWDRLHIVRCGVVEVDGISSTRGGGLRQILCVARLSPEKGHLVLLDALALMRDEGIEFRCTLVGDGPMRAAIETRVAELDLAANLTLTGALEPCRVAEQYRSADAVVLASFSEGVPVTLMEAMAYGRPVVATRVGGVPELVENGRNGVVVPPGNATALAQALRSVLERPDWAWTLGQNGAESVREEFSIDAAARRLVQLFECARRYGMKGEAKLHGVCYRVQGI